MTLASFMSEWQSYRYAFPFGNKLSAEDHSFLMLNMLRMAQLWKLINNQTDFLLHGIYSGFTCGPDC